MLDPGIGFGKTPEQSLTCIARLDAWRGFDLPLLVGASRKRFINSIMPSEPTERLGGSLAAHLAAVENGAAIIRTHDVAPTRAGARRRRRHQAGPMSDTIFVNGLVLHAYHGVMQHEAKVGQTFRLDLVLDIDLAAASRSDKLKDTVSYDTVVKTASEAFCSRRYRLVEAAGRRRRRCGAGALSRRSAASASPCTSRTRRSPRLSPMSASSSSARRERKHG